MRLFPFAVLALAAVLSGGCGSASSQPGVSPTPAASAFAPSPPATASPTARPAPSPAPTVPPAPTLAPAPTPTPVPIQHAPPYTVAIDPGHGGPYYFGAAHSLADGSDLVEKDLNLDIALRLEALLKEAGYNTLLTRRGDYTLTPFDPSQYRASQWAELQARVDLANKAAADVLVSAHFNGSNDPAQAGTEVYYNPDRSFGAASYALASYVHDALLTAIRGLGYDPPDRGVRNDAEVGGDPAQPHSFLLGTDEGFRASQMPGIIGEALFVSNEAEAQLIVKEGTRQAIAAAYKAGIDAYFRWLNGGG